MSTVLHLEEQEAAALQVRDLLGDRLADELVSYRDDNPALRKTPWERACSAGIEGAWDHRDEINAALTTRRVLIRAYHATRLSEPDILRREGLRAINPETVGGDLIRLAEILLKKSIPEEAIVDWRKEIRDPCSYLTLRQLSLGPVFAYGYGGAYHLGNMGRYFREGGEILQHITPSLVESISRYAPSFTFSPDEFHRRYRARGIPTLVVCELPYDEMIAEKQEEIRATVVRALVFKGDIHDEDVRWPSGWQGGWDEISVDRDVPPLWIKDLIIPEVKEGVVLFPRDPAGG